MLIAFIEKPNNIIRIFSSAGAVTMYLIMLLGAFSYKSKNIVIIQFYIMLFSYLTCVVMNAYFTTTLIFLALSIIYVLKNNYDKRPVFYCMSISAINKAYNLFNLETITKTDLQNMVLFYTILIISYLLLGGEHE